jgi:hypothetical protein
MVTYSFDPKRVQTALQTLFELLAGVFLTFDNIRGQAHTAVVSARAAADSADAALASRAAAVSAAAVSADAAAAIADAAAANASAAANADRAEAAADRAEADANRAETDAVNSGCRVVLEALHDKLDPVPGVGVQSKVDFLLAQWRLSMGVKV